jgi:hypothetical protein
MEAPAGDGFLAWVHRKTPENMNTYVAYSVGTLVAWGLIWVVLGVTEKQSTLGYVLAIFIGWGIGFAAASIGRLLYPPPKKVYLTGDSRQP